MELKPFDKVLVRDSNDEKWSIDFYKKYEEYKEFHYSCLSCNFKYCIPYEGNEFLFDTTITPEPKYEFKDGDSVIVWNNNNSNKKYVRIFNYKNNDTYITYDGPTGPMGIWDNCIPFKTENKE